MAPAMVATGGGGGPGLFTNSNPLDRKIVPDDPGEREVFKGGKGEVVIAFAPIYDRYLSFK